MRLVARLQLWLSEGDPPYTAIAANRPPGNWPRDLFHPGAHGITALSFEIDTPPSSGVDVGFLGSARTDIQGVNGADPGCPGYQFVGGTPEQDGNPVIITASGATTTLSFADFALDPAVPLDTVGMIALDFRAGLGPYDFCVSNLTFLDANGDEVTQ